MASKGKLSLLRASCVGRQILRRNGASDDEAIGDGTAIDMVLAFVEEIRLVLCGVVIPHLRRRKLSDAVVESEVEFLQKKYVPALLAQEVQTVLDRDRC
jgi:hypothetical protein